MAADPAAYVLLPGAGDDRAGPSAYAAVVVAAATGLGPVVRLVARSMAGLTAPWCASGSGSS